MANTVKINNHEINVPLLNGTTKQIEWAKNIRNKILANQPVIYEGVSDVQAAIAIETFLAFHKDSKDWIEKYRFYSRDEILGIAEQYAVKSTQDRVIEIPKTEHVEGKTSKIMAITKIDTNKAAVIGFRDDEKEPVTARRNIFELTSYPGKYAILFNHDTYVFDFQGANAINIEWVGNALDGKTEKVEKVEKIEKVEAVEVDDYDKEIFHETYSKILACVAADIPVYLVGPAGSGKNHTLEQVARQVGLEFYFTNSIQQEHKLTGFIDAGGTYHETEFYKAFTNGGLFFLDEMDASIPEVLVLLNAAIANGYFEFPTGRQEAHIDFRVVAAGNTMGSGADDQYTGRLVLDQATLDRFAIIEFNYDVRVEMMLAKGDKDLVDFVRGLRQQSERMGIRATYSYRCIISATKLKDVLPTEEIITIAIIKGLDKDTLKTYKVDENNRYGKALAKVQRAV